MTLKRRLSGRSNYAKPAGLALRWLLLAALTLSLALPPVSIGITPASAQAAGAFVATEISPQIPPGIPNPSHPKPRIDSTAMPSGLPAGAIARFDIEGVVKAVDGTMQEWQIGSQPIFIYTAFGTSLPANARAGSPVRAIARRTLAPGPLVAEKITLEPSGPRPLGEAVVKLTFLFNGTAEATGPDTWRVGGQDFVVNDPAIKARIAANLGMGSAVTVQFAVGAAGAVAPASGTPPATLDLSIPPAQLLLDRVGQVKAAGAEIEIKDRQYEGMGAFPVTVNGAALTANEIKIISSLRAKAGAGEHRGAIDVDIPTLSGGHITLEYQGTAMLDGLQITSGGKFKLTKATGAFNGIRAQGTYVMSIAETGITVGSPVRVSFSAMGSESILPPPPSTAIGGPFAGVSGPGYPTGPLNMSIPATQLLLDKVGQVKEQPGQLEVKDRQYQAVGSLPVTINSIAFAANEIKVISNLKLKDSTGQHQGTIDVDIDAVPGGHVTVEFRGVATVVGSSIVSKGTFKTTKTTGMFAGLVAEGAYNMTIAESGNVFGSPATVTISTSSTGAAATTPPPSAAIGGPFVGGPGLGYPTGSLNMSIPATQLLLDKVGQVKEQPGQIEIKDRQYEGVGALPVTINGSSFMANEIKVISNLKAKGGTGEHQGTIDVDIDAIPGGHVTAEFKGTAAITGSTLGSKGTFKTTKTTGMFAGLVAEGSYEMTIIESGSVFGSPAMVTIITASTLPAQAAQAVQSAQPAAPVASPTVPPGGPFIGVPGPGYATGPLNMSMPDTELTIASVGQVKEAPGTLEIKDRVYQGLPGLLPLTINGTAFADYTVKLASSVKLSGLTGQHQGTVDLDFAAAPGSHLTLQYTGTVTMTVDTVKLRTTFDSKGTFKSIKATGIFAGIVAQGNYVMTIVEKGSGVGAKGSLTMSTTTP